MADGKTVLELENISRIFDSEVVLQGIDLKINSGEHWAFLGENGSGKTTLLSIICGYIRASEGSLIVLGEKVGRTDLRELRKKIGLVTSYLDEKMPAGLSCLEMVLSGRFSTWGLYDKVTEEDRKKANNLLSLVECRKLEDRLFSKLSQGEKQRILIARALMADPLLLVLDEPFSGLDFKLREKALDTVEKICKNTGSTIILVTHHAEEIIPCISHVLMLKEGRVFASGQKEELLTGENLTNLFGVEIEVAKKEGRYWISRKKGTAFS